MKPFVVAVLLAAIVVFATRAAGMAAAHAGASEPVLVTRSMAAAVSGAEAFAPLFIRDPRLVSFPPGTAVVLDLETKIAHPMSAERRFVARAHAKGYVAWLAPSPDAAADWDGYLQLASVESDGFLAQVQAWQCDTSRWLRRVAQVNAAHPGRAAVAELSAMRPPSWRGGSCLVGDSGAQLAKDARAYSRVAVWGYPDESASPYLRGADEVAIVQSMLSLLS